MDDHDFGRLLVLQHSDAVSLGQIKPMLDERATRRPWNLVNLGAAEPVPSLDPDIRGILVLGGFMSVLDGTAHAWLRDEVALLRKAGDAEVPVLGICLGAQLLGVAHGGQVTHRDVAEIGLFRLRSVDADDPLAAGWPTDGLVLLSHADEVTTLPPDATPILASGDGTKTSATPAWRIGGKVHAVQFHPEADAALLRAWIEYGRLGERAMAAGVDPDALLAELERSERFVRAAGLGLVGRWLDAIVGRGDPSPRKHRKAA